jgi:hypothetical protein
MHDILSPFTPHGMNEFTRWIRQGASDDIPEDLLEDTEFVERFAGNPSMPQKKFADRYEFGLTLVELLSRYDQQQVSFDRTLWSWLAAYYFEQLCPRDGNGKRNPRKDYVYVLSESRIYYRHLVRTPVVPGQNPRRAMSIPSRISAWGLGAAEPAELSARPARSTSVRDFKPSPRRRRRPPLC